VGAPDSQTDAEEIHVTVKQSNNTDQPDELGRIKKLAGVNPVVLASLTDDVPE
jgi:hypothetical protein